jgi:hypothetical protein
LIITVDGPDCAGKSTLIQLLHELVLTTPETRVQLLHAVTPTQHPLDEYERPLYETVTQYDHTLCDRWDLGEHVYPQIFNRKTQLDTAVARHIELFKRAYGVLEVIINPGPRRLTDCMDSRPETERDMSHDQLVAAYRGFASLPATGNHRVYFSLTDPREHVEELLDTAFGLEEAVQPLRSFTTYVGQPRPRFILFGERRGTGEQYLSYGSAPSFGPYASTSGHYLLSHLDVPRMGGGLANACDVDDPRKLWEALDQPAAVALGNEAHKALRRAGVPHGAVAHPQFMRRFYHSHGPSYAAAIIEAAQSQRMMLSWRP